MGQPILSVDPLEASHALFRAGLAPDGQRLLDRLVADGRQHAGPTGSSFAALLHATAERLEQDQRPLRRSQALAGAADASAVPA